MPQRVITETRDGLLSRRKAILRDLGMSAASLEKLRESRTLTGEEYEALEELDEIAFLLRDER